MAKLIHSMIRVLDAERSIQFYDQAFGLKESHRLDFSEFALIYLRDANSGFEVELTLNKGRKEPYTHGDGYGHFGVVVDDLEATHARLKAMGLTIGEIIDFAPDGQSVAKFFFCKDPDGYEIEVLQKQGHYQ
ncbi:MAG: hypothetical protein RLZZ215_1417 [Pseudomonadota bacterium]